MRRGDRVIVIEGTVNFAEDGDHRLIGNGEHGRLLGFEGDGQYGHVELEGSGPAVVPLSALMTEAELDARAIRKAIASRPGTIARG